jgi:hypothetical protein
MDESHLLLPSEEQSWLRPPPPVLDPEKDDIGISLTISVCICVFAIR